MTFPLTKPRALYPGATLAILSPASTPKPELVHEGIAALTRRGYKCVLFPHALDRGPLYYAGAVQNRLQDLHEAFANPAIDGILCTRGGWGSAELLPHLDAVLIRANPKPFIAYSDHTSLHLWLHNEARLVTFHGPMAAADFSHADGVDYASWSKSLHQTGTWELGATDGLRILRPGRAEGVLAGGCLSIYAEAVGTAYAPRMDSPSLLFLEDIGTKPYQWDRMLLHLRYAGLLDKVTGIIFGDMRQCVESGKEDFLDEALLYGLKDFSGPIAIGLRSGHVGAQNITLPLGIAAALDLTEAENPKLHLLEAAVTV